MTIPYRGRTGGGTYFITASTCEKKSLLQSERRVIGVQATGGGKSCLFRDPLCLQWIFAPEVTFEIRGRAVQQ